MMLLGRASMTESIAAHGCYAVSIADTMVLPFLESGIGAILEGYF